MKRAGGAAGASQAEITPGRQSASAHAIRILWVRGLKRYEMTAPLTKKDKRGLELTTPEPAQASLLGSVLHGKDLHGLSRRPHLHMHSSLRWNQGARLDGVRIGAVVPHGRTHGHEAAKCAIPPRARPRPRTMARPAAACVQESRTVFPPGAKVLDARQPGATAPRRQPFSACLTRVRRRL